MHIFLILALLLVLPSYTASSILPYFFPKNKPEDASVTRELTVEIHKYETKYVSLMTHLKDVPRKGLSHYSRHTIRKAADALHCTFYAPNNPIPLATVCKRVRFHGDHFTSLKPTPDILILAFRPVARVDSLLQQVVDIYKRAEHLAPQVLAALINTRAKSVVYVGRGSGGSVASLLAFRHAAILPSSVITLDELPVYSELLKRLHPVSKTRYLSFLTEHSDALRDAKPPGHHGYSFSDSQVINLEFTGVDINFEPEKETINPNYFLPDNLHHKTKQILTKTQESIFEALKATHAACKKITTAYMQERDELRQEYPLKVIRKLEIDLFKNLPSQKKNSRFSCHLRNPRRHTFQILCECSGLPTVEFLARVDLVTNKENACKWLTFHALPYESEQAHSDLHDYRELSKCYNELFAPATSPFMRYFLADEEHCHVYDFADTLRPGLGAYILPLGSRELLVELMEKAPTVFYSLIPIRAMNVPPACQGILPPVMSNNRIISLKRLASLFVRERTRNEEDQEYALFSTDSALAVNHSFKSILTHSNLSSTKSVQLPEHYYFKVALCLASDLVPVYDCTEAVNQWAGYCPEACLNNQAGALCKNVMRCEGAELYVAIAPTGYLRGLKREMHALKSQLETLPKPHPLYSIFEIRSLRKNYARLFSEFYLAFIQIDSSANIKTKSGSSGESDSEASASSSSSSSSLRKQVIAKRRPKSRKGNH